MASIPLSAYSDFYFPSKSQNVKIPASATSSIFCFDWKFWNLFSLRLNEYKIKLKYHSKLYMSGAPSIAATFLERKWERPYSGV